MLKINFKRDVNAVDAHSIKGGWLMSVAVTERSTVLVRPGTTAWLKTPRSIAFLLAFTIVSFPFSASSSEVCTGGMIQKSPQSVHDDNDPSCPPAQCAYVCVAIPASAKKTGDTISVYPDPNNWFSYKLLEEGVIGGTQQYCYALKNWSDAGDRSYSLCVQYKYE
ncbi:MAG: hypothetical protein ACLPWS_06925 [Rhodomicrobium sp.]